eukprot:CAMPEP_0170964576 /NCGR_PEP_ID=MMETSP0735-20130129/40387_1 /TAXON_ID=186038 /ORGANISM="Fragilariopsis kerguelensis, Strain L26-C5" /LENGTH=46 /DNA_ID= /DNA_START= /DNA_END= /DNA_ORIENTATION=
MPTTFSRLRVVVTGSTGTTKAFICMTLNSATMLKTKTKKNNNRILD